MSCISVVVFCRDLRFIWHHLAHIKGLAAEGKCLLLPVFGGASALAHPERFEVQVSALVEEISFYLDKHPGTRYQLVPISHEDCKLGAASREEAEADLQEAEVNLEIQLPRRHRGKCLGSQLWYGAFVTPGDPNDGLRFEPVELQKRRRPAFSGAACE